MAPMLGLEHRYHTTDRKHNDSTGEINEYEVELKKMSLLDFYSIF